MSTTDKEQDYMKAFKGCNFSLKDKKLLHVTNKQESGLEAIIDFYKEIKQKFLHKTYPDNIYHYITENIHSISYKLEDIQKLCIQIRDDPYIGIYLSALVNNIIKEDERIKIRTYWPFEYAGFRHSKGTLIIEGPLADYSFSEMTGGTGMVWGNCGSYAGHAMSGGKLVIDGCADDNIGDFMDGGEIEVMADTNNFTGSNMLDGSIFVAGSSGNSAGLDMKGGNILIGCSSGRHLGEFMEGGEIWVQKNAESIGIQIKGGKVHVGGRIKTEFLHDNIIGGEIWQRNKKVYPK